MKNKIISILIISLFLISSFNSLSAEKTNQKIAVTNNITVESELNEKNTCVNVIQDFTELDDNPVSTVVKVSGSATIRMPHQHITCYAAGRHWIFYADKTNNKRMFTSSLDGVDWKEGLIATNVQTSSGGADFSIAVDGNIIHYVRAYAFGGTVPKYRRGILKEDGTIFWSCGEQIISNSYKNACDPYIALDSEGYPWVAWMDYMPGGVGPVVSKSTRKDGIWETDSGFPYELNPDIGYEYCPVLAPLSDGKMYCVYTWQYCGGKSGYAYGRMWNGNDWESEETVTNEKISNHYFGKFSITQDKNIIHYVYVSQSTGAIKHKTYSVKSGWSSKSETVAFNVRASSPSLAITNNSDVYCFWVDDDHVYYKKWHNSTKKWDLTSTDWIYDSKMFDNECFGNCIQTSFAREMNERIGLAYIQNDSSSNKKEINVRYSYIDVLSDDEDEDSKKWVNLFIKNFFTTFPKLYFLLNYFIKTINVQNKYL